MNRGTEYFAFCRGIKAEGKVLDVFWGRFGGNKWYVFDLFGCGGRISVSVLRNVKFEGRNLRKCYLRFLETYVSRCPNM